MFVLWLLRPSACWPWRRGARTTCFDEERCSPEGGGVFPLRLFAFPPEGVLGRLFEQV